MSGNPMRTAKRVRVRIREGNTGLFYGTSPDLKGLLVAAPTLGQLEGEIPVAIADLFRAADIDVFVTRMEDGDEQTQWVAFPAELAKTAVA